MRAGECGESLGAMVVSDSASRSRRPGGRQVGRRGRRTGIEDSLKNCDGRLIGSVWSCGGWWEAGGCRLSLAIYAFVVGEGSR